jgi:hypothetical protein
MSLLNTAAMLVVAATWAIAVAIAVAGTDLSTRQPFEIDARTAAFLQ